MRVGDPWPMGQEHGERGKTPVAGPAFGLRRDGTRMDETRGVALLASVPACLAKGRASRPRGPTGRGRSPTPPSGTSGNPDAPHRAPEGAP